MLNKIGYYITYYSILGWMYCHSLLPFKALYVLSDILYVIVYKMVGYRKRIVKKNLRNSFPTLSSEELLTLEKEFYHNFCDYFVETIKLLHISDEEMMQRMQFKNVDLIKDLLKDGNSAFLYLGHYGNWEWVTSLNLHFRDTPIQLAQIYRPLSNKAVDDIFLKLRKRFHSIGIAKNDTLREILTMKKEGKQTLIGFISDQTPSIHNIHYWTTFLNQDTPVYTGVERIAKKTGFSVAYLDIVKVGRGRYIGECKLITDNPKEQPEFAITEKYIREFEKTILRNPAYWLWTHNRWKHKKENVAS